MMYFCKINFAKKHLKEFKFNKVIVLNVLNNLIFVNVKCYNRVVGFKGQ